MASRMHTRPMRPTASRKSNFLEGVPKVIYSQSAASFRPPADYVGPNKARMQKPPEPDMNPTRTRLSLPILSVSKLDVQDNQLAAPATSKTSFPGLDDDYYCKEPQKAPSHVFKCGSVKSILHGMPSSFKRQFRAELGKKRPMKGSNRKFVFRDAYDYCPPEPPNLSGIIMLGRNHRNMVEDVQPQDPGTPQPVSGRRHCIIQTDTYLEDITDNETGFFDKEMQCDPVYDEPFEATVIKFEEQTSQGTQLDQWVFPEIEHTYEQPAINLADAVIMESLKQLQEEFELEALRKQHEFHKCLRNREKAMLAKYKAAQKKYEEQKKILAKRQPWDQTLDQIIQMVGFERIRDIAPQYFIGNQTNLAVYEHLLETVVPPMNEDTTMKVDQWKKSHNLLDQLITDTVVKREAEYAGKMYYRDPKKKGSLATESPSKQSFNESEEEWIGEVEAKYGHNNDNAWDNLDYDNEYQQGQVDQVDWDQAQADWGIQNNDNDNDDDDAERVSTGSVASDDDDD